jgi:tetratricopeptide (TPR) repeat protein
MKRNRILKWSTFSLFILLYSMSSLPAQKGTNNPSVQDPEQMLIQKIKEAKSILQEGVNTWNMESLKNARDLFLNLLVKEKEENVYLPYYVALCDYRLATYCFTSAKMKDAEIYIMEGQKYLEKAMEADPSFGEPFALYAALLGFEIALDQEKAMELGFRSYEYLAKALEKEPENPRINLLKGASILFTPEQFGGGADNALEFLHKSVNLFEKETIKDPIKPSWGKEEAYTFLGMAYKQKNEHIEAKKFLKKALEINPKFGMASRELAEIEKK